MLRWKLKKSARYAVAGSSWIAGLASDSSHAGLSRRVRVLTYHRFGNAEHDPFCVSPFSFEAQMAFLSRHRLALSLSDLEQFLAGAPGIRHNSVLVTIDDGHLSTWSIARPILKRHHIPAVAFVTPSMIGRKRGFDERISESYAGWSELRELTASGVQVASHSMSHRSLGAMSSSQVREEAAMSKTMLEDRLGVEVGAFAYPYGTRADFTTATGQILRDVGYRFAFTSQHGPISRGVNHWELPRIKIEGGEPLWMFRLATRGGLDQWKWIDRSLWRLQASPGR